MAQKITLPLVFLSAVVLPVLTATGPAPPIAASADPCTLPRLFVHYASFGDDCGETVNLDAVFADGKPSVVSYAGADQNLMYTLMLVDPDAPEATDPDFAYFLHWLIINIKGGDLLNGSYANGTEIESYNTPYPPEGSGLHRYQFFVFSQANTLNFDDPNYGGPLFDVGEFMVTHSLTGPVAGYQFRTEEPVLMPEMSTKTPSNTSAQMPPGSTPQPPIDSSLQMSSEPSSATQSVSTPLPKETPPGGAATMNGNACLMLVMLVLCAVFQIVR